MKKNNRCKRKKHNTLLERQFIEFTSLSVLLCCRCVYVCVCLKQPYSLFFSFSLFPMSFTHQRRNVKNTVSIPYEFHWELLFGLHTQYSNKFLLLTERIGVAVVPKRALKHQCEALILTTCNKIHWILNVARWNFKCADFCQMNRNETKNTYLNVRWSRCITHIDGIVSWATGNSTVLCSPSVQCSW